MPFEAVLFNAKQLQHGRPCCDKTLVVAAGHGQPCQTCTEILQCVLLCMCLRSSCVVSAAAPGDKLDLLRVEDGWQDVELS